MRPRVAVLVLLLVFCFGSFLADAQHPTLPRVLGGISPIDPCFIENLKGRGVLDHVDAVAVHGFPLDWNLWKIEEWPDKVAEIQALVSAWQSGAISRDTLLHNLRTGEVLPTSRTNEQELELIDLRRKPGGQLRIKGLHDIDDFRDESPMAHVLRVTLLKCLHRWLWS